MSTVREAIREQNRLTRMRLGQEVGERVQIPSVEVGVLLVPLTEGESQQGLFAAAALEVPDNQAGLMARERAATISDVWHAVRDPGDATRKVFATPDEMVEELDPRDIDYLADQLVLIQSYASPALDGLSQEELNELKKAFGETDWSGLTGRRWAAVKLCCSILFPELLQVKLRGSSSTDS
jgi:hypothetical protein